MMTIDFFADVLCYFILQVTWETLKKVNGRLKNFVLRAKVVEQKENLRNQRDYCQERKSIFDSVTKFVFYENLTISYIS